MQRLELSPDGRTVIMSDASGTAAMPVSPFESVDLRGESAFAQVSRAFGDRTYGSMGEQEYLETEGLSDEAMSIRMPDHPGHLGADYGETPAGTARQDADLADLDADLRQGLPASEQD